ncbi:MAG: pseudouridine synthase [Flavobacteriales bacterium]|nr:pseudouridine synthase [Flavobacteriales bacterium]
MIESNNHRHFVLYKPDGYLSMFIYNQNKRRNKKLLGELFNFPAGTMAIGRLDEASEGLLLLTTVGDTSEFIRSSEVEKEYFVQVDGIIDQEAIEKLKSGVEIRTGKGLYSTIPCKVSKLSDTPDLPAQRNKHRDDRHGPTSWISITLTEGKNRQVRKMTAVVGFPTLRLVRVRIGNVLLKKLKPGDVIEVEQFDV